MISVSGKIKGTFRRTWPLIALATAVTLVLLFPVYWMLVTSVLPSSVLLSRTPPLFPPLSEISLEAYTTAITRRPLLLWLYNSTVVTVASTVLSMAISTLAGYSLSRFRTRGEAVMGYALLLNRMLPATLLIVPLFILFGALGMVDNPISLILVDTAAIVPFSVWMMKGFFDSIPVELEQAAMVDGCSRLGALRRVVLPLTLPGLAATSIYSAILAWSDYVFARTLFTTPERWTVTVGTVSFIGEHKVDWGTLMAMSFVSAAPLFLLFIFLEPFLVSGMTSGSVKG